VKQNFLDNGTVRDKRDYSGGRHYRPLTIWPPFSWGGLFCWLVLHLNLFTGA